MTVFERADLHISIDVMTVLLCAQRARQDRPKGMSWTMVQRSCLLTLNLRGEAELLSISVLCPGR